MSYQKLVRKEVFPLGWCAGCGLHALFIATAKALDELHLKPTVVVSGIGCTGRGAGYFNLDSVHGLHGRAIPLAVGIKKANPKLNVVVFSGDGDLLGIGGNHFLHAARRNDDLTVVCNNNRVYGMTGGQLAPTTPLGAKTLTTPQGSDFEPIDAQGILLTNSNYFYARSSPVFVNHPRECLKKALKHQGFSFVEIISPCIANYARKMGKNAAEIFKEIKKDYKIVTKNRPLKNNELGIVKT